MTHRGFKCVSTTKLVTALALFLFALPLTATAQSTVPTADGSAMTEFSTLRNTRYCEIIFLVSKTDSYIQGQMVNTSALNNSADAADTCPASVWDGLTVEALKAEFGVLGVVKNGPRWWVNDIINLPVGTVQDFGGLEARWFAAPKLPLDTTKGAGAIGYQPLKVARSSTMQFLAGQPVFILDDPQGMPWIMQAFSTLVDPDLNYEGLQTMGERLKTPDGWSYRVKVLDETLTISAVDGTAMIVQDELANTYNACFDTACSFKP